MSDYILAFDQGTTSSRAILYDREARPVDSVQKEFKQLFPQPGWVEHDATEIWESQIAVAREVLSKNHLKASDIAGIGITNQRETTVIWNRQTGNPIHNAIVWQDRRTSAYCKQLVLEGKTEMVREKTGLVIDAYFSGTKLKWLFENVSGAREMAEKGELAFGTIDSWLIWNLTSGRLHITDVSNASRTMLYNIHTLSWDADLLDLFDIPESVLPKVVASSDMHGLADQSVLGHPIVISGIAGDQQAALFGQMCVEEGMAKCTYGTGCFLMLNTGKQPVSSKNKLLTTIGWKIGDNITYALEGSVFIGGAVIQWLRDGLQFFQFAEESEALAGSVADNGGVYFVPALTGLGAPHWDQDARGTILGITRGTNRAHITRAALESIGFQVNDVLTAMAKDMSHEIRQLRVDGGAVANDLLVQFQADISGIEVIRPLNLETTALGAAYLAGLGTGLWNMEELQSKWEVENTFNPGMEETQRSTLKSTWSRAVERAKAWDIS